VNRIAGHGTFELVPFEIAGEFVPLLCEFQREVEAGSEIVAGDHPAS